MYETRTFHHYLIIYIKIPWIFLFHKKKIRRSKKEWSHRFILMILILSMSEWESSISAWAFVTMQERRSTFSSTTSQDNERSCGLWIYGTDREMANRQTTREKDRERRETGVASTWFKFRQLDCALPFPSKRIDPLALACNRSLNNFISTFSLVWNR